MKKLLSVVAMSLSASLFAAMPEVTSVTVDSRSARRVTVNYVVSGSVGFVTCVFETNFVNEVEETVWVPLKAESVRTLSGDVNRMVAVGAHQFKWNARKDFPDHKFGGNSIRVKVTAFNAYDPPDYVAIDLTQPSGGIGYYSSAEEVPGGVTDDVYKTTTLLLRRIHAAGVRWRMGSPTWEGLRSDWELAHMVTLSRDYYIGVYEFTQKQYELVAGYDGSTVPNAKPSATKSRETAAKRPVTNVTFGALRGADYGWPSSHAVDSTRCLGLLRTRTGLEFDLPTSAQWEYACRAGEATGYYKGVEPKSSDDWQGYATNVVADCAWTKWNTREDPDTSSAEAHVVGQKLPNNWGLYDMCGNVAELCLDWYSKTAQIGEFIDPVGPAEASGLSNQSDRMWRGGDYTQGNTYMRSAASYTWTTPSSGYDFVGFRVCCPAVFN